MSGFGMRPREPFLERHHVLTFLALAAVGVGLATLSVKQPESVQPLHDLGAVVTGPVVRLGASASGAADDAVTGMAEAFSAKARLDQARAEIDQLRLDLADRDLLAAENEALRETVGLAASMPMATVAARVIYQQRSPDWILIIDRGAEAGIEEDQAVISPTGVVGKVLSVGNGVARIQGVLDGDAGVAVMIGDGRRQADAIVSDASAGRCRLTHVQLLSDIRPGDRVLTSGLDLVYPRGLLFGIVEEVKGIVGVQQEITVIPAVDFSRLEQVLVVIGGGTTRGGATRLREEAGRSSSRTTASSRAGGGR